MTTVSTLDHVFRNSGKDIETFVIATDDDERTSDGRGHEVGQRYGNAGRGDRCEFRLHTRRRRQSRRR